MSQNINIMNGLSEMLEKKSALLFHLTNKMWKLEFLK